MAVGSAARRSGSILVVDDYDDARVTVREALESAGYDIIEAKNGQHALSLLVSPPAHRVSLIILDLQMPVMDGWRLLELLRCYVGLSNIPVIVTTAQQPRLEQVRHAGVFGWIQAPYEITTLLEMVDSCIAGAGNAQPDSKTQLH